MTEPDDLDGCDLDFGAEPLPDDQAEWFVLFADALDPATPSTPEAVAAEWKAIFG